MTTHHHCCEIKRPLVLQCLCLLALALQALAGALRGGIQTEAETGAGSKFLGSDLQIAPAGSLQALHSQSQEAFNSAGVLGRRRLSGEGRLSDEGDDGTILAAGPMGIITQYAGGDDPEQPALTHSRMLLGKDDDEDDEEDESDDDDGESKRKRRDDEDKEDEEEEDEEDGLEVDVKAIVGVHIKQLKLPKGCTKRGKLMRRSSGKPVLVETPISDRFGNYVAKNRGFLKRVAYEGTIKRKELNAICKKVAKGKTNFKTDLNVDEARGAPDTGDDITGAKVDHQFGCTVTKGPRVKLNPELKNGVVFMLLELGKTNNLIDCQKGVKKCNMWTLLDDEDVEDLTDLYGSNRRRLMAGRRGGISAATDSTTTVPAAAAAFQVAAGAAAARPLGGAHIAPTGIGQLQGFQLPAAPGGGGGLAVVAPAAAAIAPGAPAAPAGKGAPPPGG